MLVTLLLIPLVAALGLLFVDRENTAAIRTWTRLCSAALFVYTLVLAAGFHPLPGERFDYETTARWIPSIGAGFSLGIDGISLVLVLLTGFLAPITAIASESAIGERKRDFFFWFFVLHVAMLGAFVARDLFLFFIFWELMLVPMALMIGIWGSGRRIYASLKFFIFTLTGSLPMLAALIYLTIRYRALNPGAPLSLHFSALEGLNLSSTEQLWCFLAFALSFAIKVPLWPLHTWLPDAHTEAPTPGSIILAGVLLKMGGYGFIRIAMPLFPDAAASCAGVIDTLAVIAIIAGSLVAMVQKDLKRLVAYSSVAHMGAVMLGIFSLTEVGLTGALFQMLAHGLSTGGLFLLVGLAYERRHTRLFSDYGGIAKVMPVYAACFVFTTLASIALPGLCGFVGEFMIIAGAFQFHPAFAAFAAIGAILGAWYMLGAVRRIFFGEITQDANRGLKDLNAREVFVLAPLMAAMLWLGLGANRFIDPFRADVQADVARIEAAQRDK